MQTEMTTPKRRGRPPKMQQEQEIKKQSKKVVQTTEAPKRRGRPKTVETTQPMEAKKKGGKRKPYLTSTPEMGYATQVGFMIDGRFLNTLKDCVAQKGLTVSEITRKLLEMWVTKEVEKN